MYKQHYLQKEKICDIVIKHFRFLNEFKESKTQICQFPITAYVTHTVFWKKGIGNAERIWEYVLY